MPYYDPYGAVGKDDRRWLKCQFHMHNVSFDSDGRMHESLEGMDGLFREYKAADYDIVAHSTQNAWLDTSHLDAVTGIRSFPNEEYVDWDGILLVGARRAHRGTPQEVIDACDAEGGFAVICHPNQNPELHTVMTMLPPLLTREISTGLRGVTGVEIYNGCLPHRAMGGVGFGIGLATDYWDEALSTGRLLWGFGSDDSHQRFEVNVGWTDVLAAADDFATVRAAVKRGALVASRGMRLVDWWFDGERLEVEADLPYQRTFNTSYSFVGEGGALLSQQNGRSAAYRLTGEEQYVRVEARGDDGSMLWTQPLLRDDAFDLPV